MKLLAAVNLSYTRVAETEPWALPPDLEILARLRGLKKAERRRWTLAPETRHNFYSAVRGTITAERVTSNNEVAGIRAFVADFDAPTTPEAAVAALEEVKAIYQPTFLEMSLGGKARLVWLFDREVKSFNSAFAENFFKVLARLMGAERLLAGYDPASIKPTQLWTNGCEWYETGPALSEEILQGAAVEALKVVDLGMEDIDIVTIAEEVKKKFPNRWQGDFIIGAHGVRFWDPAADNPRGAYVTPHGCYCFTGATPFMSWDEIFGAAWVRDQRVFSLGKAAKDLYFDGKTYWQLLGDRWYSKSREDTYLWLGNQGIKRKVPRNVDAASDAERVLNHIQLHNRVAAAVPLVHRESGIVLVNEERILNICTTTALPPAAEGSTTADFPWLHGYLTNLFERVDLGALDYFLTWLRRAYVGALTYRPLNGQAIFVCGPRENGKTLLCMKIVAPLLGGKTANPYDYLMKATQFNSEIFSAPLLAINDEEAPSNEKEKEVYLQRLKSMVANHKFMYHPKFRDRFEVDWIGRMLVTLNDDPKSVRMIPEVNHNTEDKFHFFATKAYRFVWPEKYTLEAIISKELPHFARWLIETYRSPEGIESTGLRCGMKSFHDPVLIEMSKQQDMAYELRELLAAWLTIGQWWAQTPKMPFWVGTPTALISSLNEVAGFQPLMKEWTVSRMARSLTSLARIEEKLIQPIGEGDRSFRIYRKFLEDDNEHLPE
jgi:hypothetical protein